MKNDNRTKKRFYRSSIIGLCSTAILLSSTAVPVFGAANADIEAAAVTQAVGDKGQAVPAESKEVTRTISYLNPLTNKQESIRQVVRYQQDGDQLTPLGSPIWPEFFSPEFAGFETDQVIVQAVQTDAETADKTVTIEYYPRTAPNRRKINIHFNSAPATSKHFSGDQQILKTIHTVTDDNGDLLIPEPPAGWKYFSRDLPSKVHFSQHGVASLNLYVCPLAIASREQIKEFQRELILHLPAGDQHLIQRVTAKRVIVTENGVEKAGKWTIAEFPALRVPTIPGYGPSQALVPALQPAPDQASSKVEIYYYQTQNNNSQTENTATDTGTQTALADTSEEGTQTAAPQTKDETSQTETTGMADSATQTINQGQLVNQDTQTDLSSEAGTQTAVNPSNDAGTQTRDSSSADEAVQTDNNQAVTEGTQTNNNNTTNTATQTSDTEMADGNTQTVSHSGDEGHTDTAVQTDNDGPNTANTAVDTQTEDMGAINEQTQTDDAQTKDTGIGTSSVVTVDAGAQTDSTQSMEATSQTENEVVNSSTQVGNTELTDKETQTDSPVGSGTAADTKHGSQAGEGELPSKEETGTQTDFDHGKDSSTQTVASNVDDSTQTDVQDKRPDVADSQTQTIVPAFVNKGVQTDKADKFNHEKAIDSRQEDRNVPATYPAINEGGIAPTPADSTVQPKQTAKGEIDPLAFHNALTALERPLHELDRDEKEGQLPQTGNQVGTKATVIGLFVTLLAGLTSLWTLKKRR